MNCILLKKLVKLHHKGREKKERDTNSSCSLALSHSLSYSLSLVVFDNGANKASYANLEKVTIVGTQGYVNRHISPSQNASNQRASLIVWSIGACFILNVLRVFAPGLPKLVQWLSFLVYTVLYVYNLLISHVVKFLHEWERHIKILAFRTSFDFKARNNQTSHEID